MARVAELDIRIAADSKGLDKNMTSMSKSFAKFGKAALKVGAIAGAAILAVGTMAVKAAANQEKAEQRLETIMTDVTKATTIQIQEMKDLASQTQDYTTVSDDAVIAGQSQLASFNVSVDTLKTLNKGLIDVSVANYGLNVSQEQTIQTANLMGKVMQGQVGALSRVGVTFNEAQEQVLKFGTEEERAATLATVLQSNFGDLAKDMKNTFEGRLISAKNKLGDMSEKIGLALMPALEGFLTWVDDNMPAIQETIENVTTAIGNAWEGISGFFEDAASAREEYMTKNYPEYEATLKRLAELEKELGNEIDDNGESALTTSEKFSKAFGEGQAKTMRNGLEQQLAWKESWIAIGDAIERAWKWLSTLTGADERYNREKSSWTGGQSAESRFGKTTTPTINTGNIDQYRGGGGVYSRLPDTQFSYAQGTNYVPDNQVALIHKGEAVLPADQNPNNPDATNANSGMTIINNVTIAGADPQENANAFYRMMQEQLQGGLA